MSEHLNLKQFGSSVDCLTLAGVVIAAHVEICVSFRSPALKWFRKKGNIQAEVEEMQEEQRSLSCIETLSVWALLTDRRVRWQVLTIVVVNIGMQLSGIDAVRTTRRLFYFLNLQQLHLTGCS